ncbi:MAG: hypothetical protein HQK55_15810 [Deltaproteobacteria bacterium]|nr:hypothetical protein [Deltaproteobacteria bacterium]
MSQTILNIYIQTPDQTTEKLAAGLAREHEAKEVFLDRNPVDYDRLVDMILESDRVVCWF